MKKFAALTLALTFVICIFAACEKKKTVDGGTVVVDDAGQERPVATKEDGGYIRNEYGDVVILATNENGDSYTNASGDRETTIVNLDTALVLGNLIEFERYYIELPDGWSNFESFNDMGFRKDGTEDQVWISEHAASETNLAELVENANTLISAIVKQHPDAVTKTSSIKIGEKDCPFYSAFVADNGQGKAVYFSQALYDNGGYLYTFTITSDRDLTDDLGEISGILSKVIFK